MHDIFSAEQQPAGAFRASAPAAFLQLLVAKAQIAAVPRIIIDGPSGSGKSTLGKYLARQLDAELVHLDNVYASWDGLADAGQRVATELLGPLSQGQVGRIRHWDWHRNKPAKWQEVSATRPVVVEGSAALNSKTAPLATLRIWVEVADEAARKNRALTQRPGGEIYAPYWEHWGAQERAHITAEKPYKLADLWVRPGVLPGEPLYTLVAGEL
ncbi:ATP-binding protein [Leucobacter sp. OH2974_COT-288]|uniref:(d)CMP kinase n=1 Tax=Canibacter oris TaxID=1365628 RepID=A0A840DPS4_9MICO|nr:(d)CMP kinase [Canibacter oris]MBB4072107.1 hypothetical protein [Canibacter oris]RRD35595.1 ATP-binding protein [Leucobacter sp. OH2974_COT-288]